MVIKTTQENGRPSKIHQTLQIMQSVKILFQVCAPISVSVAGVEGSFSTLQVIKTNLHNPTGNERLRDLAVTNKNFGLKLNM